jgi:hypothetical protein
VSAGQNVGPLDREGRCLFQPPLPPDEATWALAAAAGISTVGLRPSFVIPAAAHSHPDCRAILILIVAPQWAASSRFGGRHHSVTTGDIISFWWAASPGISNFPPAPKLDPLGQLDPSKATPRELAGERVFTGKGRCAGCHVPEASFMDNQMHDLKLERFYQTGTECEWIGPAAGWTHQDVHASRYKGLAALHA